MEENNKEKLDWRQLAVVVMLLLMIVGVLSSCKTREYISIPEYHTEYIFRADTIIRHDSVYVGDSIYVYNTGDTTFVNKVVYKDKYHYVYKVINDTVIKYDSIRISIPTEQSGVHTDKAFTNKKDSFFFSVIIIFVGCVIILWYKDKKITS